MGGEAVALHAVCKHVVEEERYIKEEKRERKRIKEIISIQENRKRKKVKTKILRKIRKRGNNA